MYELIQPHSLAEKRLQNWHLKNYQRHVFMEAYLRALISPTDGPSAPSWMVSQEIKAAKSSDHSFHSDPSRSSATATNHDRGSARASVLPCKIANDSAADAATLDIKQIEMESL
jgi:hypothetical protein